MKLEFEFAVIHNFFSCSLWGTTLESMVSFNKFVRNYLLALPCKLARCVFKQSSQMTPFMSLFSLAHIYKVI